MTGKPLRLPVKSLANHKSAACVGVPCVLAATLAYGLKEVVAVQNIPPFWLAAVFHASVPAFWDVLSTAIVSASDSVTSHLEEVGESIVT